MTGLHVAHVVVTASFAGVERYLTYIAPALIDRDVWLTVIGGDRRSIEARLVGAGAEWRPGSSLVAAARALVRTWPDIVHTHMTAAEVVAVATAPLHRAPIVTTRHFARERGSSLLGGLAAPVVARAVKGEIAMSAFVADSIGQPGVVTIPNGVPTAAPGANRRNVLLVAQRLEDEKETDVALRAWALTGLAAAGWRLEVAGRGARDGDLRRLASDLGVAGSVDFVGFDDNLSDRLASSAALLATARVEAFGLTVVEAMARATPVVAAAGGAHLETVGSVSTRWLFPPGDVHRCAELLQAVPASAAELDEYGRSLRARQLERFSVEAHVNDLVSMYERVRREWGAPRGR